jgi:hypothetical protein
MASGRSGLTVSIMTGGVLVPSKRLYGPSHHEDEAVRHYWMHETTGDTNRGPAALSKWAAIVIPVVAPAVRAEAPVIAGVAGIEGEAQRNCEERAIEAVTAIAAPAYGSPRPTALAEKLPFGPEPILPVLPGALFMPPPLKLPPPPLKALGAPFPFLIWMIGLLVSANGLSVGAALTDACAVAKTDVASARAPTTAAGMNLLTITFPPWCPPRGRTIDHRLGPRIDLPQRLTTRKLTSPQAGATQSGITPTRSYRVASR